MPNARKDEHRGHGCGNDHRVACVDYREAIHDIKTLIKEIERLSDELPKQLGVTNEVWTNKAAADMKSKWGWV